MANQHQNRRHPYSSENTQLKDEMEAAVREAVGEAALPSGVYDNSNGESHSGDGYGESHSGDGYSWSQRVVYLEREVLRLDNENKSLKEKCRNGFFVSEVKQKLQNFEQNLALFLYPGNRKVPSDEIFPRLMNWLNVRRGKPQGVVPNTRWSQVKREVGWNLQHEAVLTKLRNLMPDMAQPVEMWNPVSFTEEEICCIADLCRLSQRLTELIDNEEDERELMETL